MKLLERLPLRARLFLLVSALVLGVLVTSAIGFFLIEEHLEELEVTLFLEKEADKLVEQLATGRAPDRVLAANVDWFPASEAPAAFRALGSEDSGEVLHNGRTYSVLRRLHGNSHFYIALPENEIEQLEVRVFVLFAAWVVVLTAIAMFLAYRMSARLVGPVSELARRVESLAPTDRGVRLAPSFRGEEVERIARAIDVYLERLEGFVEREQSFTSSTSHELRTPLAIISGAAEILADSIPPNDSAPSKALERIQRATAEMNQFIDALLALARASDTADYRAETDVAAVLKRVVEDLRDHVQDSVRLDCHCDGPLPAAAPPALVHIVVANLLRNALRYTRAGTVQATCTDSTLTVRDEGAGMSEDVLAHAFERHFSGSGPGSPPGSQAGSGIGLYLVKRICDQFGWQVTLESRLGEGTTARVRFR